MVPAEERQLLLARMDTLEAKLRELDAMRDAAVNGPHEDIAKIEEVTRVVALFTSMSDEDGLFAPVIRARKRQL